MSELEQNTVTEEAEKEASLGSKRKKNKKEKEKKPLWKEILSWIFTILGAVAAALVIRSLIVEPVKVDGESMLDTLNDGEIMLVSKFDYSSAWLCLPWQSDNAAQQMPRVTIGNPQFLDVVICRYPARGAANFVKRVVGMPGDTVELRDGYLYVNGRPAGYYAAGAGPFLPPAPTPASPPFVVPGSGTGLKLKYTPKRAPDGSTVFELSMEREVRIGDKLRALEMLLKFLGVAVPPARDGDDDDGGAGLIVLPEVEE